ncbi:(2,3-dihydroxybenzoyl)adenylate synthase [Streptomyces sp. NPDC055210]
MTGGMTDWPAEDAERYRGAGYWAGLTFAEVLKQLVREHGDRIAVVDERTRLGYAELDRLADRAAAGLAGLGVAAGDRVVVQLPNRAEFVVLWFALMKLGAVPIHALPGYRWAELTHLAEVSEAVAYVIPHSYASTDHRAVAERIMAGVPSLRHVLVVGAPEPETRAGFTGWTELLSGPAAGVPDVPCSSRDLALLLLSGGTTGTPKMIPRTHDDYLYNARRTAEVCGLDHDSVYLTVLPVAFNFTMACPGVLGTLVSGGRVVLTSNPEPGVCLELVEREGVTITSITPQLAPLWTEEAREGGWDLSSLRVFQVGGAPLAESVARELTEALGCTFQQAFGMAEGLVCLTRPDEPLDVVLSTQGRPVCPADEVLIVDAAGDEVPEGAVGELLTRGPYTLRGYYRAPEHNRRSFTPDGFYRTGDLVRRLPGGHLVVSGRSKDQINRGGEKIAAAEVEGHLQAHPAVRSVALVGVPDPEYGERALAFIVPAGAGAPQRQELGDFLLSRGLASYKVPDRVEYLSEMPLTPVGKIDKKALARRL